MSKISKEDILKIAEQENIGYVKLKFTDILGALKNVEITVEQLEEALDGETMCECSAIESFEPGEESDMFLKPHYNTRTIFLWSEEDCRVARLRCDVYTINTNPFEGDPGSNLNRIIKEMKDTGYHAFNLGP